MKRTLISLFMVMASCLGAFAMSYETARQEALYLTDKMAYELNLNDYQYEAVYEVNLDYLLSLNTYDDAYSTYWVHRNTDLSYILFDWQYTAFCAANYFYRPLFWANGAWGFHIYVRYPRHNHFFFGYPVFYDTYRGGHGWHHNGGHSWYHGRDFGHGRPGMHDSYRGGGHHNNGAIGNRRDHNGGGHNGNGVDHGNNGGNHGGNDNGSIGNRRDHNNGNSHNNSGMGDNTRRHSFDGARRQNDVQRGAGFSRQSRESSTRTTVGSQSTMRNSSSNSTTHSFSGSSSRNSSMGSSAGSSMRSVGSGSSSMRSMNSGSSSMRSMGGGSSMRSSGGGSSMRSSGGGHSGGGHFGGRR